MGDKEILIECIEKIYNKIDEKHNTLLHILHDFREEQATLTEQLKSVNRHLRRSNDRVYKVEEDIGELKKFKTVTETSREIKRGFEEEHSINKRWRVGLYIMIILALVSGVFNLLRLIFI